LKFYISDEVRPAYAAVIQAASQERYGISASRRRLKPGQNPRDDTSKYRLGQPLEPKLRQRNPPGALGSDHPAAWRDWSADPSF
jgi:hypothetical protein